MFISNFIHINLFDYISDCGGCDRTSTLICDYFEVVTRKYHNASELKIDFCHDFYRCGQNFATCFGEYNPLLTNFRLGGC